MVSTIINFIGYNLVWYLSITSYKYSLPIYGIAGILFLLWHLATHNQKINQLLLIGIMSPIGWGVEWLHATYAYKFNHTDSIPIWLMILWCCFSCTLTESLNRLIKHKRMAVISGVIFGPLAYVAAESLGAISIQQTHGIMILSMSWGSVMLLAHILVEYVKKIG